MTDFEPNGHGGLCAVGRQLSAAQAIDIFYAGPAMGTAGLLRSWYGPRGWRLLTNGNHSDPAHLVFSPLEASGADQAFSHLPSAVSWAKDRLDVFAVNDAGDLWHFWSVGENQATASWSGESLGHPGTTVLDTAPSAVALAPDRITVFARGGQHGALVACVWDPASGQRWQWHNAHGLGWAVQPTPYAFAPAATSWGSDRIDLFGVTGTPPTDPQVTDAVLEHTWQQDFDGTPAWHPDYWEKPGRTRVTSSPVAVSWADPQRIVVVYCLPTGLVGSNVAMTRWLGTRWATETLHQQTSAADGVASYPALASWGTNRVDAFWFRSDGTLQHGWNTEGGQLALWGWETFPVQVA